MPFFEIFQYLLWMREWTYYITTRNGNWGGLRLDRGLVSLAHSSLQTTPFYLMRLMRGPCMTIKRIFWWIMGSEPNYIKKSNSPKSIIPSQKLYSEKMLTRWLGRELRVLFSLVGAETSGKKHSIISCKLSISRPLQLHESLLCVMVHHAVLTLCYKSIRFDYFNFFNKIQKTNKKTYK